MMVAAVLFGLAGGAFAGNAIPHFVRGITRQHYPNVWGNGPIPNVIGGWCGLVIAAVLLHNAFDGSATPWAFGATAVGVLAMGLFHAGPGAFGLR
jgi:hypothetical protein